jgi:hypothetical protein
LCPWVGTKVRNLSLRTRGVNAIENVENDLIVVIAEERMREIVVIVDTIVVDLHLVDVTIEEMIDVTIVVMTEETEIVMIEETEIVIIETAAMSNQIFLSF